MKKFISLFMLLRFFPKANLYLCKKTVNVNTKINLSEPVCHSSESRRCDWAYRNPVILKVFDIMSREVQTFVNESLQAETYLAMFYGTMLTSGVYFYKMQSENFSSVKKMLLVK